MTIKFDKPDVGGPMHIKVAGEIHNGPKAPDITSTSKPRCVARGETWGFPLVMLVGMRITSNGCQQSYSDRSYLGKSADSNHLVPYNDYSQRICCRDGCHDGQLENIVSVGTIRCRRYTNLSTNNHASH